ncbi:SRF-TF-domain-containing protein [Delitschia confertaspora ATCC 74209]|uniref:SRF-TF-domain-containing protein n=1 Tax=Delitschia confertaspora ATCC 74209 TaxID=1513339 RepID=A0A9P4MWE8_9PLEO|nr:SRF-TF-domain-containing protein [Delitschia confertaspora ATCC 74209]
MANEITDHDQNASPSVHDDGVGNGNNGALVAGDANRGTKRPRPAADDDDDDDEKPGRERRKIEIKFIQDKSRRHITFSKRKAGIMKKAYELSVLTGTQVLLLVVSETGLVYTFTTPKLQPLVTKAEGKNLIQACLNAPEPSSGDANGIDGDNPVDSPEDNHAQVPAGQPRIGNAGGMPATYMTPDQAMQYQSYLQHQQVPGQYPGMPQGGMPRHPGHQYPPDQKLS